MKSTQSKGKARRVAQKRKSTPKAPQKSVKTKAKKKADLKVVPQLQSLNQPQTQNDYCHQCQKNLKEQPRALYVEEEIGRVFCSEECIAGFFAPEVDRLEKEYLRKLSSSDLTGDEKEKLNHLRWVTLEEPDEVWREKTLSGDHRYTFMSEFQPGDKPVWMVCICLALRAEPSFLFLAFPTKNSAMVNAYRRGEQVDWAQEKAKFQDQNTEVIAMADEATGKLQMVDGLDESAQQEHLYALSDRSHEDIPAKSFEEYEASMEPTLETPDEVWSSGATDAEVDFKVFHFVKYFAQGKKSHWYVIVAKETEVEDQIELLDAFPTMDPKMVERFRTGELEVTSEEHQSTSRLVH